MQTLDSKPQGGQQGQGQQQQSGGFQQQHGQQQGQQSHAAI